MGWGFLTSYSLKSSYEKMSTHFDNFDIMMMVIAPVLAYLVAESLTISGLLSLMTCGFILSVYARKNLGKERAHLVNNSFIALAYFSKNVCDLFIGIGFGLFF